MLLLHSYSPSLALPISRRRHLLSPLPPSIFASGRSACISCGGGTGRNGPPRTKAKKKENVWSVDNELAARERASKQASSDGGGRRRGRRRRGRRVRAAGSRTPEGRVLVSGAMLMEIETVLQAQEPVIKPSWNTFASSVSGQWKGVGAVFSPFTAEMEPVGVGSQNENLYDCYTFSRIEKVQTKGSSQIMMKTNWVTLNPFGETQQHGQGKVSEGRDRDVSCKDAMHGHEPSGTRKEITNSKEAILDLPSYGSFDFGKSDLLDEDVMVMGPGLVFFEDGSYSRGPMSIPVGDFDESKYFISPTFKFEQCLVKGCHKRLRIVHTIEFSEGGADIRITRVAVYEEQWASPVNLYDGKDDKFEVKPISQRRRTRPSELSGSWKVFEVSATPIFDEEDLALEDGGPPFVYLCTENLKKRSLPESSVHFSEEEMLDMQDITVLWLPGGVTAYVDVTKEGILCIGVGWYSDEGINLVMERDYGMDGKLKEVRSKTEVKRRWTDSFPTQ